MQLDFTIVNIITLFGAIQGFTLCGILTLKNKKQRKSVKNLVLFIFSLSFLNFFYSLLDAKVLELYKPLYLFPFPYKYLIGVGFFFYLVRSIQSKFSGSRLWNLLFVPGVIYGLLHVYWMSISIYENSYRITSVIIATDFFRINEFVYLFFTLALIGMSGIQLFKTRTDQFKYSKKQTFHWLRMLTIIFFIKTFIDLLLYAIDLIIHEGQETLLFYYPNFLLNSGLIYGIGIIGFLKPEILLTYGINEGEEVPEEIKTKIESLFREEEIYLNKKITINEVAQSLGLREKQLSMYIRLLYNSNFSQVLNHYRVEKVKSLIDHDVDQKYTLVALAEEAGFSSKSSFNNVFKQLEGVTPSEYRKLQNIVQHS